MALTAAQTQTVYEACGLRAEGNTYRLLKFHAFTTQSITESSTSYDYSNVKTLIDANLAALSTNAETQLGDYITKYDDTATSSVKLRGEVIYDAQEEHRFARDRIVNIVGIECALIDEVQRARDAMNGGRQGSVVR